MIAARTTTQAAEPADQPERDLIGHILLYKMDWCEKRPGLMLAAIVALIVLEGVFEQVTA